MDLSVGILHRLPAVAPAFAGTMEQRVDHPDVGNAQCVPQPLPASSGESIFTTVSAGHDS